MALSSQRPAVLVGIDFADDALALTEKAAVLASGPYAFYRCAEASGATATDASGNSRNGTYVQMGATALTYQVAGPVTGEAADSAIGFPASGGRIDVNFSAGLEGSVNGGDLSQGIGFEAWFYFTARPVAGTPWKLFAFQDNTSVDSATPWLEVTSTGVLTLQNPGTVDVGAFSTTAANGIQNLSQWYHVAIVITNEQNIGVNEGGTGAALATVSIVRNGVVVASAKTDTDIRKIYAWMVGSNSGNFLRSCRVDEVAVYDFAPPVSDFARHYSNAASVALPYPLTAWTDVSGDIDPGSPVDLALGRQQELDVVQAGVGAVTLNDPARRYEPEYAGTLANQILNPSFEVATSSWATTGTFLAAGATLTRVADAAAPFGAYVGQVATGAPVSQGVTTTGALTLTGGVSYVVSCYLRRNAGGDSLNVSLALDASPFTEYAVAVAAAPPTATYQRYSAVITPATTGTYRVYVRTATGAVTTFFIDAAQVEQAGQLAAYVDGSTTDGKWEGTAHASRSLRGGIHSPNIVPMRRIRVQAVKSATTYELMHGYVERWPINWPSFRRTLMPLTCVDALAAMSVWTLNGKAPAQLTGARVNLILDRVGWPAAARAVDAGQETVVAAMFDGTPALSHLQAVADSETGIFFIDRGGVATFHDRDHRTTNTRSTVSQATFGEVGAAASELPYLTLEPSGYDVQRVYNEIVVTSAVAGAQPQIAADITSQNKNGQRPLPGGGRSTLLSTDAAALAQATALLARLKDPHQRFESMTVDPQRDEALWVPVLTLGPGDRITVRRRPYAGGSLVTQDVFIERRQHMIGESSWLTSYVLSPV